MKLRNYAIATVGMLALSSAVSAALPGSVINDRAMAESADLVFQGTVKSVEYAFSDANGGKNPRIPHTFVTYEVDRVIAGTPADTVTLRFIGGRGEEAAFLIASESPLFDVGDTDILMVRDNTVSGCPLVDCGAGRFRVISGKVFSEEGQAVELNAKGDLVYANYFDLEEVMTHQVSQTTLARVDQLEQGEQRLEFVAPGKGAHISDLQLSDRVAASAKSASRQLVKSADIKAPFTIDAFRAVAPPAEADAVATERANTAQERAELQALKASGGNPAIGEYTGK